MSDEAWDEEKLEDELAEEDSTEFDDELNDEAEKMEVSKEEADVSLHEAKSIIRETATRHFWAVLFIDCVPKGPSPYMRGAIEGTISVNNLEQKTSIFTIFITRSVTFPIEITVGETHDVNL